MDKEIQEIECWTSLRKDLKNSHGVENVNWIKAIELFNERLKRKFFKPIESIIIKNELKGEGFTIVTVQCALIEALASFTKGKIYNHNKKRDSPNYEYNNSGSIYIDFLENNKVLKDNFYIEDPIKGQIPHPSISAKDFYDNVRCGLLQ